MDKEKIINGEKKILKHIKCMNYDECKNKIYSEGNHHRLCDQCRKKAL